jgi:hypothetical protein
LLIVVKKDDLATKSNNKQPIWSKMGMFKDGVFYVQRDFEHFEKKLPEVFFLFLFIFLDSE